MVCIDLGIQTSSNMGKFCYKKGLIHHLFVSSKTYQELLRETGRETTIGLGEFLIKNLKRDSNFFIDGETFSMKLCNFSGTILKDSLGQYFVIEN